MATRVMCWGDSITEGQGVAAPTLVPGGYRGKLYTLALAADRILHLVGPVVINPTVPMTYPGHAGYSGTDVNYAMNKVAAGDFDSYYPDVFLFDIGNNNLKNANDLDVYNVKHSTAVTTALTRYPTSRIICATIGPYDTPYAYANAGATPINTYIRNLPNHHPLGHRIFVADIAATLTIGGLGDGLHPNTTGYDAMATVWWSVLQTLV